MHFTQELLFLPVNMHKMRLICENNTLDVHKKDDYTKFQISSIRFFDNELDKQVKNVYGIQNPFGLC